MGFENSWITCLEPEKKGLFPGTKVHFTQCIACDVPDCAAKGMLFAYFFPADVNAADAPLNKKVMELNDALKRRKKGVSQLYCPKKKNATTNCTAKISFCRYNTICGRNTGAKKEEFIRSIRWRKAMIYVVKYLDGTTAVVDRNDFSSVDIDKVEKVYSASYEVKIVSELVPLGEESSKLNETVSVFNEKYNGNVVTHDGMVTFEEWFKNSSNGDSAVIPEKILVPQKTYKVIKVKSIPEISARKGIKEIETPVEPASDSKEEKKHTPEKMEKPKTSVKKAAPAKNNDQPSLFDTEVKTEEEQEKKVTEPVKRKGKQKRNG